jgi:hypothetical protein
MKHVKISIILSFILAAFATSFGQTTQMPKWAFNGKQIDFTQSTPQVQNTNASLSSPRFVSNAYYGSMDDGYPMLFQAIDNEIYWADGSFGGYLWQDNDAIEDLMPPEMVIVPKDTMSCGNMSYYILYDHIQVESTSRFDDPLSSFVVQATEITPGHQPSIGNTFSDTIIQEYNMDYNAGFAVSDFLPGTNTRRMYVVYRNGFNNGETKILRYDITPSGMSSPTTIATGSSNDFWEPAEVEISPSMDKLVFVRPKRIANTNGSNDNDITIVNLDPTTGNLASGGITTYDLEAQNSINDKYVGIELDANGNYAYVVKEDEKMLKVDLSDGTNTTVTPNGHTVFKVKTSTH